MVAVGHFGNDFGTTASLREEKSVVFFIFNGSLAVYIFFIVSGYALTTSVLDRISTFSLKDSIIKRYVRLSIPVTLSIIFTMAFFALRLLPVDAPQQTVWSQSSYQHAPSWAIAVYEALWGTLISGHNKINPPLWTLKWEFIASIILYISFFVSIKKYKNSNLTISMLILCLLGVGAFIFHKFIYLYVTFIYGVIFSIIDRVSGSEVRSSRAVNLLAIIVFISAIVAAPYVAEPETIGIFVVAIGFHGSVRYSNIISKIFSSRFFCFFGRISFPLYLTHFPVLCALSVIIHEKTIELGVVSPEYVAIIILSMISIAVATLFSPVEKFTHHLVARLTNITVRKKQVDCY